MADNVNFVWIVHILTTCFIFTVKSDLLNHDFFTQTAGQKKSVLFAAKSLKAAWCLASVQYVHDVCIKIDLQMADGLDYDDDDEVPTEEMVERMEERLELVQNQQKRLFLIIFQVIWEK